MNYWQCLKTQMSQHPSFARPEISPTVNHAREFIMNIE